MVPRNRIVLFGHSFADVYRRRSPFRAVSSPGCASRARPRRGVTPLDVALPAVCESCPRPDARFSSSDCFGWVLSGLRSPTSVGRLARGSLLSAQVRPEEQIRRCQAGYMSASGTAIHRPRAGRRHVGKIEGKASSDLSISAATAPGSAGAQPGKGASGHPFYFTGITAPPETCHFFSSRD